MWTAISLLLLVVNVCVCVYPPALTLPITLSPPIVKWVFDVLNPNKYYHDQVLTIDVSVGTPLQHFNLTLEYNDAPAYLFAASKNTESDWQDCQYNTSSRHYYDPTKSSTYSYMDNDNNQFNYAFDHPYSGCYIYEDFARDWTGFIANETWRFGNATRTLIPFEYAPNASNTLAPSWPSDGIFGFAATAWWDSDPTVNTINFLLAQYKQKFVTFFFDRPADPAVLPAPAGHVTFGGKDPTHCSNKWINLAAGPEDQWSAVLDHAQLGSAKLGGNVVLFSSTSAFIYTPWMDLIVSALGAEYDFDNDIYTVNCDKLNTLPDIKFVMLHGDVFTLASTDYAFQTLASQKSTNTCTLMFLDSFLLSSEGPWVFGTAFLGPYCLGFDYTQNTVAIAKKL